MTNAHMAMPTAYLIDAGKIVSGDQNPSMKAAMVNISAAPYMILTAGLAASINAALRERNPGTTTEMPSFRPAAPESMIAVSSIALWPDTKDQNDWLKSAPLKCPATAPICAPLKRR